MLTQNEAQAHAHVCGMHHGTALPLPVVPSREAELFCLKYDVIHPETMAVIIPMGHYVTGYVLNALRTCFGIDYVVIA